MLLILQRGQWFEYVIKGVACQLIYVMWEIQGVPKNVLSLKNGHKYFQNYPKCKSWGCFGKFRIFVTRWAEILIIKAEMTEKMKP